MRRQEKICARRAYCSPTLRGRVINYSGAKERTRDGLVLNWGDGSQSLEQIEMYESRRHKRSQWVNPVIDELGMGPP